MRTRCLAVALGLTLAIGIACGGGDAKDRTPTSAPVMPVRTAATTPVSTTEAVTPARTASTAPASATTGGSGATTPTSSGTTVAATAPAVAGGGRVFDDTQAKALLDEAPIKPADVGNDWAITSDAPSDNATASAADPTAAASFERCGRLNGRLLTNGPNDVTTAYITGQIVSVFTQLTVYKTADGAADCAVEGATRFAAPGALARAFGAVFKNPDAVTVQPIDYPQVADGSFAAALTGDIDAGGLTVQLEIVIVAFRSGNTTAVVGVAYSPLSTPSTDELKPYVDLVAQRLAANQ